MPTLAVSFSKAENSSHCSSFITGGFSVNTWMPPLHTEGCQRGMQRVGHTQMHHIQILPIQQRLHRRIGVNAAAGGKFLHPLRPCVAACDKLCLGEGKQNLLMYLGDCPAADDCGFQHGVSSFQNSLQLYGAAKGIGVIQWSCCRPDPLPWQRSGKHTARRCWWGLPCSAFPASPCGYNWSGRR